MSDDKDDFVTIRPRQAPLTGTPAAVDAPAGTIAAHVRLRRPVAVVGTLILLLLGAWVFFYLPGRITPPAPPMASASQSAPPAARRTTATAAPFEGIEQERARKAAQDVLARFVTLQIRLDDEMQVEQWAPTEFAAAQQLANDGDQRFRKENFDGAIALYEQGTQALTALVADGQARFDAALADGLEALARGDAVAALAAFERAGIIHPDDPQLRAARQRAEVAPAVAAARRDGERAESDGDWAGAIGHFERALALDSTQSDLPGRVAALRAQQADAAFANRLSAGYQALDARDLDAAQAAFAAAARARPADKAAQDGLVQVAQARTLSRIEAGRQRGAALEAAEDWTSAAAIYADVLAIDGSIKFARDGRARADMRAGLDARLQAALADPGVLSADTAFAEAVALYDEAVGIADPGTRLTAQLDRLESMLATAARAVPVVITSDSATQISVFQVGSIGAFARKELNLRPGRYVITGSRAGCRDVRVEVMVVPDMPPVDIRCRETI